jgi:hypothetical protein
MIGLGKHPMCGPRGPQQSSAAGGDGLCAQGILSEALVKGSWSPACASRCRLVPLGLGGLPGAETHVQVAGKCRSSPEKAGRPVK